MKKPQTWVCLCGLSALRPGSVVAHSDYLPPVKNRFFACYHLVHFMGACLIDFQGKMSGVPIPQVEVLKVGVLDVGSKLLIPQ